MARRITTEEWIIKAKFKHGDRYDYSKVEYTKSANKVTIICKDHGEFEQSANNHLKGSDCHKCTGRHSPTTEEWIERARAKHGDRYDYSKVEYAKSKPKVTIICKEHGEFEQQASGHLQGQGCPECAGHNQKESYINLVDGGFLKYGISGDSERRVKQQISNNKIPLKNIGVWEYDSPEQCRSAEAAVKRIMSPVASKHNMPDGWSETAPLSAIDKIINIYESHGGIRV